MTFEEIKRKVDNYRLQIATSKGKMAQIEENWQKTYGTSDVQQIRARLHNTQADLQNARTELDNLLREGERICNELG